MTGQLQRGESAHEGERRLPADLTPYRYTNLTSALKDKASPLRRHLARRFPLTKLLQADYRASAGPLLVEGGDANPGTLGAALDYQLRFTLDPDYLPLPAVAAFANHPLLLAPIMEVVRAAGLASGAASPGHDAPAARACWALALLTEVYRGGLVPGSAVAALVASRQLTAERLLALAPEDALRQLAELSTVADRSFFPTIRGRGRLALGPTFEGSKLCSADADLIAGDLLVEVKTYLGARNPRTGRRSDGLASVDLYQVVSYALFDRSDTYGVASIAIYSARYGHLVSWPLRTALSSLAGTEVDLNEEREQVWLVLGGR